MHRHFAILLFDSTDIPHGMHISLITTEAFLNLLRMSGVMPANCWLFAGELLAFAWLLGPFFCWNKEAKELVVSKTPP